MSKETEQLEFEKNVLQSLQRVSKYYFEIFKKLSSSKLSERDNLIKDKNRKKLVDLGKIFTDKNPLFDLKEEKIVVKIPQKTISIGRDYIENESVKTSEEDLERLRLYELHERVQQYLEEGKKQVYLCYPFVVFKKNERELYYTPIWLVEVKLNHNIEKNCIEIERIGETEFNHYVLSKFLEKLIEEDIIFKASEIDLFNLTETNINDILDTIKIIFNINPHLKKENLQNKNLSKLEKIDESKINDLQNNTLYLANNLVVCLLNKQDYHLEKVLKSLSELEIDNKNLKDTALYHLFTPEENNYSETENQDHYDFYDLILPANEEQKMVIKSALKNNIVAVEGPPGTGKSYTIANLALYLLKQGKSVLITSYKEEALQALIEIFKTKVKIRHDYLYISWLKGDKKAKEEIIRKLDNINYQLPIEEKRINLLIDKKEELERQITNYIEKQKKFGYLYEKVYKDLSFINKDVEGFINEIKINNIAEIKNILLNEIENLNLKEEIDQQIENILDRLKGSIVINNLDFKGFISYVDLFVKLIKENYFDDNVIDNDIIFLRKVLSFLKNEGEITNDRKHSNSETYKRIFRSNIESLKGALERSRWHFMSLRSFNLFDGIFDNMLKFQSRNRELDLFYEFILDIKQILSNLINEYSRSINFLKNILQKLEINQLKIEESVNIKKTFENLNSSLIELKNKLSSPNFIKRIYLQLLKILNRNQDPLKEDLYKFLQKNRNLIRILEITDIEKLLDDEDSKKDVMTKIHDVLNQLRHTNFLNFICEIDSTIKNYDSENFINKEAISSYFRNTLKLIKEEINKNILSEEALENIRNTLEALTEILDILKEKNENLAIKTLFEIYGEEFIFKDLNGRFSLINKLGAISEMCRNNLSLEILEFQEYENLYRISSFIVEKNIINTEKFLESVLIKKVLENLEIQENIDELQNELKEVKEELRESSKNNLANQINKNINEALKERRMKLLVNNLKEILRKKKVTKIEEIKNQPDFPRILEIFKIWIIKIEDVFRIFPFRPAFFDYVIIDEASQLLPVYIPPLAYISKKLVVIGDDKQLRSPELLFFNENEGDILFSLYGLNEGRIDYRAFKITRNSSSLGLIRTLFSNFIQLKEHFRCLPEIIKFSNEKFYNNNLKIMTDGMERIGDAFEFIKVESAKEESMDSIEEDIREENKINKREAEVLVDYLVSLLKDPKYQRFSFGVMSLFRPQADYIYYLFRKKKDEDLELRKILDAKEENESVKIGTADAFQGKERDFILYSFRYAPNSKPSTLNTILREDNFGHNRLNVALTRARRKMILFISEDIDRFPENILKDFLLYAKGSITSEIIKEEFDSDFERDVYERMKERGYKLFPQYPACGYRIDLALFIDNLRIGIECDGWQYHYDKESNLKIDDIERQEVLERAGWKILRIPSTRYWKNPDACIDELVGEIERIVKEHKKEESILEKENEKENL